jgi:hypothetical protein
VPSYATERRDPLGESQLEGLLRELLEREGSDRPRPDIEVPREIAELRDAARRLRAASQWMPLPEGRFAVRRALLATAAQGENHAGLSRAPWRRASLWLSLAAVAAFAVGAFGLGAGALNVLVPPSSPVYGLRLMLDQARGTFVPGHPNPGQYALSYQFPAVQIPAVGGVTSTAAGKVGGLPAALALTAAGTCATGGPCGRFVVSLAGLSTPASAKFGELRGTFACGPDGCTLALVKATGVFARVSAPHVSVSGGRVSEGRLTAKMASRGEWVAEVAMAAESLEAGGMLPAGMTVSDLVNDADTNERDVRRSSGPNGSVNNFTRNIVSPIVGPGAPTGGTASGGVPAGGPRGTSNAGGTRSNNTNGSGPNRSGGSGDPGGGGANVDGSGAGGIAGPNGHGGGLSVNGGASAGDGEVSVGSGANINDSAPSGNGGVSVGGGTSVNGGGNSAGAGVNVNGGGNSAGAGVNVNGGGNSAGAGVNVNGGGSSAGAGVNVNGGGSGAGGGVNVNAGGGTAGGGANINAGAGSGAGGGANVNAGAGSSAGGGVNVNAGTGSSAGGGVNVNAGTGGINVNGGGVSVSGGTGGGGSSGGGSREAGSGSH